jgi:endonuclease III
VMIFTWDRPEIPVDTHVKRVGTRLGLFRPGASFDEAHDEIMKMVDPEDAYEFHINLIRHGRAICKAQRPRCDGCPLLRMCPFGRALRAGTSP